MSDAIVTQRCYVCEAYFADKVKLGLHIALCYGDAVRRGVTGLPQPAELLQDEKRYTEYMRDKHLDAEIALARRNKVSFATQEDFSAMRSQLAPQRARVTSASASPTAKPREIVVNGPGAGRISGAGHRPPSDHLTNNGVAVAGAVADMPCDLHEAPAYRFKRPGSGLAGGIVGTTPHSPTHGPPSPAVARPASRGSPQTPHSPIRAPHHLSPSSGETSPLRPGPLPQQPTEHAAPPPPASPGQNGRVASGVTMLRNELASELANVRQFLADEQARAVEREREHQLRLAHGARGELAGAPPQPQGFQPRPSAGPAVPSPSQRPPPPPPPHQHQHRPVGGERPPSSNATTSGAGDQLVCPNCGRVFGRRGYAVHTARCGKHATDDFTFSKDAQLPEQRPGHVMPDKPTAHSPQAPLDAGQLEAWQQFMVTYPRPVIAEAPQTPGERAVAAKAAADRKRFLEEMQRAGSGQPPSAEPRVPCGRCGRMFVASRVRQHEGVCVANPVM